MDWRRRPQPPLTAASGRKPLVIAGWSVLAIGATFVEAVARLGLRAVETIQAGLEPLEWVALALSVSSLTWFEGHRALQRRFAPAVVARALEVGARSTGLLGWLAAPLRTLSLIGAPRRELVRAWVGVGLIVLAVVVVQALPFPWRGIIDAGVAAALLLGLFALLARFVSAARAFAPGPGPS